MKHQKKGAGGWFAKGLACVVSLSFLLTSCVKNNSDDVTVPTALMTVIQASPDEPPLDFYLNSNKVNQSPITYGTGIDYFSAIAGQRTAYFYQYGTTTPVVASAQVTLEPNMAYSLFLDNTTSHPSILFLTDSLIKPPAGKAGVRFVDLSPDAPAADLVIQGGATIASNKSFQGYTSFLPVSGQNNFTLQVVKTGTSTVLASLSGATLTDGYLYTVMFEGLNNSTNANDKLTMILITNAYFN